MAINRIALRNRLLEWRHTLKHTLKCPQVRSLLPGYLDGALPDGLGPHGHLGIARHLEDCSGCRQELETYRNLSRLMSSVGPAAPPADLGISIRVAVSRARARQGVAAGVRYWLNRAEVMLENILEPLALPATGGLVAALLVFAMIYQVLGTGMPLDAATPDSPTSLMQPARLEVLAGFQMSRLEEMNHTGGLPLLVEASVNSSGQAVGYRIISGRADVAVQHELDQVLLFSKFRPQMSFGRPMSGGRVVLSFSQIRVQG
jgi:hypothetical protein